MPPGITGLLVRAPAPLKRLWDGPSPARESIQLCPFGKTAAGLEDLLVAPRGEIVWVNTDKLRLWGRALTPQQNQHVRYYEDGIQSFRRFYELHQPRNQFEAIMLDDTLVGSFFPIQPPKRREPWSLEIQGGREEKLGPEHGTQRHGPVSERKLLFEKKRLDRVRRSVEKRGFIKRGDDFIRFGEVIIDDSDPGKLDFRVVLQAGYHRASLLAYLGWPLIPMMPSPQMSWRDIRLSDLPRWPGLLDGTFSEEAAWAYFRAHFRDPAEELLPGW